MMLRFAPPTTRMVLGIWFAALAAAGFAQLYRSEIEQFTGTFFLVASVGLFVAMVTNRVTFGFVGFGLSGVAFATRGMSAFFMPTPWHGRVLIVAAWGLLTYLAAERAVQSFHHVKGVTYER